MHGARSENQLDSESDDEPELEVLDNGGHNDAASSRQSCKQRKQRRFKFFVVFHGDRASRRLPHSVRIKCPRDDCWGDGLFFTSSLDVNTSFLSFAVGRDHA